jgi:hypothetical protein
MLLQDIIGAGLKAL